nr:hypothetical protein [Tanacetum cinerariifolium]
MVIFLKKPTGSEGFQEIVDFLNGSHIRAIDNEEQQIIATVNGKEFTITEASIRRHLQLADADVQDSGNILKTQSTAMHNVPLPWGIGTGGSPRFQETTRRFITQTRVLALETNLRQAKKVYGTAYTKLTMKVKKLKKTIKSNQARRRTKVLVSNDDEDSEDSSKQERMIEDINQDTRITLVTPTKVSSQEDQLKDQLGVLSAAKVLADVAKKKVNTYIRRRRAVISNADVVQEGVKDKVTNVDWDDVQAHIQADEELAHKMLKEERQSLSITERVLAELIDKRKKLQTAQRYKAIRNKLQTMSQQRKTVCTYMKNMAGAGLNLQEESSKRQKIEEGSKSTEEPKADEISQEDLQQLMMIVPAKEVYVEAIQNFDDRFKRFDKDDLFRLWDLVKERFSITKPTNDKENALWVELKRLFKPDNDDILWKLQSLYYKCGLEVFEVKDEDDVQYFVNEVYGQSGIVQKLCV